MSSKASNTDLSKMAGNTAGIDIPNKAELTSRDRTAVITIIFAASMICYGLFRVFYAFKLKKIKDSFEK